MGYITCSFKWSFPPNSASHTWNMVFSVTLDCGACHRWLVLYLKRNPNYIEITANHPLNLQSIDCKIALNNRYKPIN